jgi:hypothetical protein
MPNKEMPKEEFEELIRSHDGNQLVRNDEGGISLWTNRGYGILFVPETPSKELQEAKYQQYLAWFRAIPWNHPYYKWEDGSSPKPKRRIYGGH